MTDKNTILEKLAALEAERVALQAELEAENKAERAKTAAADIAKHVDAAYASIAAAEALADEFGIDFSFSVGYGMGGTYRSKNGNKDDWNSSSSCWGEDDGGWVSSSSDC